MPNWSFDLLTHSPHFRSATHCCLDVAGPNKLIKFSRVWVVLAYWLERHVIYRLSCRTKFFKLDLKVDVLLTVHHGTLMNQHQLDTLFLVCLLGVKASTCCGRYLPIFRRLCTDAVWCNYVRRMCVDYLHVVNTHPTQQLCRASWRWASNARNM
jgi:hypothetical protein